MDNSLHLVEAKDLQVGMYVPMPKKIDVVGYRQKIDVYSVLKDFSYIKKICIAINPLIRTLVSKEIENTSNNGRYRQVLSEQYGVAKAYFYEIVSRGNSISFQVADELCQNNKVDFSNLGDIEIVVYGGGTKNRSKSIKVPKEINEDLAYLAGILISDGHVSKNYIDFCAFEEGVRDSVKEKLLKIFGKFDSYYQKIDAPPRLKSHGLKRCSIFGCSKCRPHSKECGFRETLRHKEIPSIIFNISKELQLEFLRTYFLGDGTLSKHNISFTTISRNLADQLLYLLQSFGVMASLSERDPGSNNLIVSKNRVYTVSINSKKDLLILKKVWQDHRNASLLQAKIESNHCSINRKFETISEDLVGLEVKEIRNTVCSGSDVYDFSVEDDENFIAGFGGLCCHNTDADVDGAHIRTLLLTFFFRFMHKLIENGNVYIAVSPLYRVRKRGDHYVYSEKELKELLSKITGNTDVQRFKGLGEMNPEQLWETTMNPKTRMLKKVVIQDGVKADEVFSKLMGDNVEPRKQFIAEHASEAQIDI